MQWLVSLFAPLEAYVKILGEHISLPLFVPIGSFIEEVVAPIPAPLVMTTAGSLAYSQGDTYLFLFGLAILGAIGKTLGAVILYYIGDKGEDVTMKRFGKYFAISHEEIEGIGRRFTGHWKDTLVLFILRAIPVIPSLPLSLGSGIIKLSMRTYLLGTFFGLIPRSFFFLYLGYAGLKSYGLIATETGSVENILQILVVGILALLLGYLYFKRSKDAAFDWFKKQ